MTKRAASNGEYLATLSAKYEVDPDELFLALISTGENMTSTCGGLTIKCRSKMQTETLFLILKGSKAVAQFPVSNAFLLRKGHPIRDCMNTDRVRKLLDKRIKRSLSLGIKDLRSGMRKVSLKAKVLEISEPTRILTRYGNYASLAKALIGDDTGTIKMCLWNKQIGSISEGDTVQIENARTSSHKGQKQLSIGKTGLLINTC